MHRYPKILQFRNIVDYYKKRYPELKSLKFIGTTKVHGTNGAVVTHPNGDYEVQSRNRIITPDDDNYGFAKWVEAQSSLFVELRTRILTAFPDAHKNDIVFYGEWAGEGINNGVAVNQLPKFFYIFAVKILFQTGSTWLRSYPDLTENPLILDSRKPFKLELQLDFENLKETRDYLEAMTALVEKQCPVASYYGAYGTGEGIVWEPLFTNKRFKTKGEKHKVSKTKRVVTIDPEKHKTVRAFTDYAVTENRMLPILHDLCPEGIDRVKLGTFLKAVRTDIAAEEGDVLKAGGFAMPDVTYDINNQARTWFFEQEEKTLC